jgi:hypothetical protein
MKQQTHLQTKELALPHQAGPRALGKGVKELQPGNLEGTREIAEENSFKT